jgi:hypothetical protein
MVFKFRFWVLLYASFRKRPGALSFLGVLIFLILALKCENWTIWVSF